MAVDAKQLLAILIFLSTQAVGTGWWVGTSSSSFAPSPQGQVQRGVVHSGVDHADSVVDALSGSGVDWGGQGQLDRMRGFRIEDDFGFPRSLQLRGGDPTVLPAPGDPNRDGSLRKCAACNTAETQVTLGHCKITELHFCAGTECRKIHWLGNK